MCVYLFRHHLCAPVGNRVSGMRLQLHGSARITRLAASKESTDRKDALHVSGSLI